MGYTKFDFNFKNGKVKFNYENILWSGWALSDLDTNDCLKITHDQFSDFVENCSVGFAEMVGEIAHDMFDTWCNENGIEEEKN